MDNVIENPILSGSSYEVPTWYWRFDIDGIVGNDISGFQLPCASTGALRSPK